MKQGRFYGAAVDRDCREVEFIENSQNRGHRGKNTKVIMQDTKAQETTNSKGERTGDTVEHSKV